MATSPPGKFLAMQDTRVEDGVAIRPEPVHSTIIEAPSCGFRIVTWVAEHPDRGWESGVMLVSRDPYENEAYASNSVAEILWGRGYVANYRVVVVP
jgi:hypothetical protein